MSVTDEVEIMTSLKGEATPAPGCWVVTESRGMDGGTPFEEFELAWSPDGTMAPHRPLGFFPTRGALDAAVAAMEGSTAHERPSYAERLATSGFVRNRPGLEVGPSWVRPLGDGRTAFLTTGTEIRIAIIRDGDPKWQKVGTMVPFHGGTALAALGHPDVLALDAVLACLEVAVRESSR